MLQRVDVRAGAPQGGGGGDAVGNARGPRVWMGGWIDENGLVLGDVFGVKMFMRFINAL